METNIIVFCGGHVTPALAVIEALKEKHPEYRIAFLGRRRAFEGKRVESLEYKEVQKVGIPFYGITTGRLQRFVSFTGFFSLLKIPVGCIQALVLLLRLRPKLVVSFGGYVALPTCLAAAFLGIPVVTHEQTRVVGLANRIIARLSKRIFVSFAYQLTSIDAKKTVVTGLPLRKSIFSPPEHPSFPLPKEPLPIIYITGGSTGALTMNDKLFPVIGELTNRYRVVHQTGDLSFDKALDLKKRLAHADRYVPIRTLVAGDVSWLLKHAVLVIGRSGANTVSEVAVAGPDALFIPLPWSGGSEQYKNAQALEALGRAKICDQENFLKTKFLEDVEALAKQKRKSVKHDASFVADGAINVVSQIDILLSSL